MLAGLPLISKEEEKDDSIVMKSFCHKHGPRFCFRGRWVVDPKKTFVEQSDVLDASLPAVDTVQQLLTSVFDHERSPTRPSFYKVPRFSQLLFPPARGRSATPCCRWDILALISTQLASHRKYKT